MIEEKEQDILSCEEPPFVESLTTTLWEPEDIDNEAEGCRRSDMTGVGYSVKNTTSAPAEDYNNDRTAEEYVSTVCILTL